jgi:lipopolysaccharide transport system permease protein
MNLDLVLVSAKANLWNQTSQTYFGWLWWVVEPIMTMLVYYFVFEFLLNRGGPGFVYLLLIGVVAWSWFGNTVSNASTSILRAKGTISCININKAVFPAIAIVEHSFRSAIVFSILMVFLLLMKGVSVSWWYLSVIILEQSLLIAAFSMTVAGLVPFFPDLNFIVTIVLRAAMFGSGVFYTVDMLPENIQGYFMLNPMANIIDQYRSVLLYDTAPDWNAITIISGLSVVLLVLAMKVIKSNDQLYPRLVIQ